uniref:Protein ARV n=1 Tax=Kalanchoe fedtschenkoi TaxID=63787 RepID=A0A7N1A458_KALFE
MELRCVQCEFPVERLFVQYSPGNIRLMKCPRCKQVADEYIECEIMIVLIDLILHKTKAYRHLLHNVLSQGSMNLEGLMWKLILGFLLLDTYRMLVLVRSVEEWSSSISFYSLVWKLGKVLMDVFLGNLFFLVTLVCAIQMKHTNSNCVLRYRDLLLAILVSSHFKIFLVCMMVWEFPISAMFLIDVFILSSNTVALTVMTQEARNKCAVVCFGAHAVKFLATSHLYIHLLNSSR